MYHDVEHQDNCRGLTLTEPELWDCTCGVIIKCLVAERTDLQGRCMTYRKEVHMLRQALQNKYVFAKQALPPKHKPR